MQRTSVTPEEARNGWTPESLSQYLEARAEQKKAFALDDKKPRVAKVETTRTFNPHQW